MNNDITIITAVYNGASTITDCLNSISNQTILCEHVIIDGLSSDRTLDVIRKFSHVARIISEPDNGIYDAMNKGLRLATGKFIGILNADDFYINNQVLEKVVKVFNETKVDAVYADLVYVNPEDINKVVRYYRAANFTPDKFAYGWMPPHPTFFVRREIYEKYGLFKTDYRIAADYELLVRFMAKHRISCHYIPEVIVKMRTGGVSTKNLKSNWILNKEIVRACAENGINTNLFKIYLKYLTKSLQLVSKPA